MKKDTTATIENTKNNGYHDRPPENYVTTDQGKLEAVKHIARPPDFKSQMELSNFTEMEVECNAIIMVQNEFKKDQTIDCVERHLYWKSVFRRSVDGQLTEELIQVSRNQTDPLKGLQGFGGDFAPQGRSY